MSNTLIHIVSGQTMQNLLPLLALKPSRVVQISSNDEKILKIAQHIEAAARLGGSAAEFLPHLLESPFPTTEEVRQAHKQLLSVFPGAVVNMTGGTKLMSLGAYLGASEFPDASILYCDTDNRQFIQAGKKALPDTMLKFNDIASTLKVPLILSAQGFERGRDWKVLKASSARIQFGAKSIEMLEKHPNAVRTIYQIINRHSNAKGGKKPDNDDLERATFHPIPISNDLIAEAFMAVAQRAQFVLRRKQGWFFNLPERGHLGARKQMLTKITQQLVGGAYEGHVHAQLEKSQRFGNFLHGVMPASASEESAFGETDFLAVETSRLSLALISCKSAPPSLEHLESLIARKSQFGGNFARAILCVKAANDKRSPEIRKQCRLLGIECLIGNEVSSAFSASKTYTQSEPPSL